jgi:outer membrane protein assembly factor BamB
MTMNKNIKQFNRIPFIVAVTAVVAATALLGSANAQNWASWRGPEENGISRETNLVEDWSLEDGKNVLWKSNIGGRSTPIILNGQVYINCRTADNPAKPDERIHIQEQVVCFDAQSGEVKWQDKFNVFQTDIPAPRVGWAAMTGDPETGNVFSHSVSGIFRCYAPDGTIVWEKSLAEQYGKISGYGGRTQTPFIDEDRVIVSYLATNWGDMKGPAPKHYYYAFDKKTGELLWISAPGGKPQDTNYSALTVGVINGQRILVGGNADGGVYAMNARTGKPIWSFRMSKRGLNTTPVIDGNMVYISHGEDNIDNTDFGRVQCIDATGTGDVTETHSVWRVDGIKAGYTALLVKDGILYVVADIGNMIAFDTKTGDQLWTQDLGTVGKGSPIWADGKIYATEVNGNVWILKPSREKCEVVNHVRINARTATGLDEIYASPAIANGRLFITTRDRTVCIEDKSKTVELGQPQPLPEETAADGTPALIQLRPYEVNLEPGASQDYKVVQFDANGRLLKTMDAEDLKAGDTMGDFKIDGNQITAPVGNDKEYAGTISTTVGGLEATARVRTFRDADVWAWDFEGYQGKRVPISWNRAFIKVQPFDLEGNTVMKVTGGPEAKGRPSHQISIGPDDMTDYEMTIDVRFEEQRRQLGSLGLSVNRYNLILDGNRGRLKVQSWPPHLRMAKSEKYRVDPDVWYTLKMKVNADKDKAVVLGKVWKTGEAEPEQWTLEQTDPHSNMTGSPGVYIYAQADCYFDNVKVFRTPDKEN